MGVDPTDLLGVWQLQRRVLDRRTGQRGRVAGRLELAPAGSGVRWLERGELTWDGGTYEVTRELHVAAAGDGWMVRFADGRPFHPWRPGEVVEHPCRDDLYRGIIRVDRGGRRLRVLWDVCGPGKDQRIVSRCRRDT